MSQFLLNPRIAADLFDGDFILANLDTGIYYSLTGLGVFMISKMPFENQGKEFDEIVSIFPNQQSEVFEDLKTVWGKLVQEEIIILKEIINRKIKSYAAEQPSEFIPSKLSKYADMQDLLMMDPIHEVDEDGWPVQEDDQVKKEK